MGTARRARFGGRGRRPCRFLCSAAPGGSRAPDPPRSQRRDRPISSSSASTRARRRESCARCRISFACARPIPARARWSRRRQCKRLSPARISRSRSGGNPSASGPRCASSASVCAGVSSHTRALLRAGLGEDEFAVALEAEPERRRLRPLRARGEVPDPPCLIRWIRSWSSPSAVGKRSHWPRRVAPASRRPSSSRSGGSNVFRVAMWAGPAWSTGAADTSGASSRTQASTSGSSGIRPMVSPSRVSPPRAVQRRAERLLPPRRSPRAAAPRSARASRAGGIGESRTIGRRAPFRSRRPRSAARRPTRRRARRRAACRAGSPPDDEAHDRVHPPLQPLGRDRLPEADLGDVVDEDPEAEMPKPATMNGSGRGRRGGEQAAESDPAAPMMIVGPTPKQREMRFASRRAEQVADAPETRKTSPITPGEAPARGRRRRGRRRR